MIKVIEIMPGGVKTIQPPTIHEDFRGQYIELYNEVIYKSSGVDVDFVQDDMSTSTQGVLRGLHGDMVTWKLISCLVGRIYVVVLDRATGGWVSVTLSEVNRKQLLVPPGYALGHLVMSDCAIFHYKQSAYYNRESQFTIAWNDPKYSIYWPIKNPILSERDALHGNK